MTPLDTESAFHAIPADTAMERMEATARGLSEAEAARRREIFGPNRLPAPAKRGPWMRFLAQFNNVLIYVLLGAAAITTALGHFVDTGVILAVVLVNAIIGFIQEGRAEQAMDAIRHMLAPRCSVLRDGRRQTLDAVDLVPGDVVMLEAGDKVPADLRLLETRGLRIEEAVLTGESVPVDKQKQPVEPDAALGDRASMAFSSTLVAAGTGRGIVVATGEGTEIGRISGMIAGVQTLTTPLVEQMDRFARWLTLFILLVAGVLFLFGYFIRGMDFSEVFMAVVSLSVAAIPEGLPAVLTITLAVGVRVMAQRNAIVRRLPAIETLGSVSVICSDKTGTLTRNEMMAAALATAQKTYAITGEGYAPKGDVRDDGGVIGDPRADQQLMALARAAALCNDAVLHHDGESWRVDGDPMEGALTALAGKISGEGAHPFAQWERIEEIPFDAAHRYMAVLNSNGDGEAVIHVKGAPEAVLAMCSDQFGPDGQTAALDPEHWHELVDTLAADGQRVLALAVRAVPPDHNRLETSDLDGQLTLLGLVGLIDPPRTEAIGAVAECHSAGIRVKMITGDHGATARAIAEQIGLKNTARVLTGSDLEGMDDAALERAADETDVFARTSPEHKLRLVEALQARGLTVAMTGDGANDAPALKRADAGIAMGRKGNEAAKEASELVLADDNFVSIAAAVREGRTVYENIRKVISWTLPTNGGEAGTIIVALFAGMTLPISPVQILWINLVTAITLGLALAFEPSRPATMQRPPRPRNEPLLSGALVWQIILVSGLFILGVFGMYRYAIGNGYSHDMAQTAALNTLVILEIFYLFFIRNIGRPTLNWETARATPIVWGCVGAVLLAQAALTYWAPFQVIFGTASLPVSDVLRIIGIGVVFFAIVETEKQIKLALHKQV